MHLVPVNVPNGGHFFGLRDRRMNHSDIISNGFGTRDCSLNGRMIHENCLKKSAGFCVEMNR